ncbi:hypothetical protein DPX16_0079 [Anabarilius grahami]|uniref:Uncharacterized protein n=1 Tax=Anabarilius grahami TaxID=495550 RepID=A0A3N0XPP0_ANAGA|nr:hypothetical protein DPX16_0079 [Anabarilius grahami]
MEQIKSLLLSLNKNPVSILAENTEPVDRFYEDYDIISTAASNNTFWSSPAGVHQDPESSAQFVQTIEPQSATASQDFSGSSQTSQDTMESHTVSLQSTIRVALPKLGLDTPPAQTAGSSALFWTTTTKDLSVPVCKDFVAEYLSALGSESQRMQVNPAVRTLSNMEEAEKSGLANMPAVEPCVAALVVSPDEALRPNLRCPSAECRRTDDLIVKAHNTATRVGFLIH